MVTVTHPPLLGRWTFLPGEPQGPLIMHADGKNELLCVSPLIGSQFSLIFMGDINILENSCMPSNHPAITENKQGENSTIVMSRKELWPEN